MIEIIQVNISGEDKPGLTTALTSILAQYDATILDIGQENIHKSLTLGILFLTTPEQSGFIMKDLLFLGAGALILRAGSRKLAEFQGAASQMPVTCACMAVGLVSIMGLPPFAGFYGKFAMIRWSHG